MVSRFGESQSKLSSNFGKSIDNEINSTCRCLRSNSGGTKLFLNTLVKINS